MIISDTITLKSNTKDCLNCFNASQNISFFFIAYDPLKNVGCVHVNKIHVEATCINDTLI